MQSSVPGHCSTLQAQLRYLFAICLIGTATMAATMNDALGQSEIPGKTETPGQTESPATGEPKPSEVQEPPRPDLKFKVGWVSSLGSYTYVPERWGELHINLVNSRDESRELMCVTYFDEDPQLQYARRVWLPARSKLEITHPVLLPKCDRVQQRSINFHSLIFDNASVDDVLIKNETGQLLQDGAMLITQEKQTTAVIGKVVDGELSVPEEVLNLIVGGRTSLGLSDKLTMLAEQFLPADETSLACFQHIVIADDRVAEDLAALTALRHWLNSGGHLWVMLDRVDLRTLEALLGDDFRGHLVDRIGLTSVRIDQPNSPSTRGTAPGDAAEFETPVQMARVVIPDMEVTYTVNNWPAALTRRCGDGQLLITTLGARGWMKPRDPNVRWSVPDRIPPKYVPILAMDSLATVVFSKPDTELFTPKTVEPQVREYVGYSIPPWGVVVGTLLGFSLLLLAAGLFLWRAGRLEHLGWVGSAVAVAVSLLLLTIGHSYRHRIPETIASVQIARALTGTDDVRTDGLIAVYHPEGSDFGVKTSHGGRMMPEMTGVESSTRRMVTTDFGIWHWENLRQPAGLRMNFFTKSEIVPDRIEVKATFSDMGLVGKYLGRLAPGTDALVATREGRMGVDLQSDGSFVAGAEDVFEKDQFLNANLVGDEQDRRRRTLRELFTNPKRRDFPDRPQLMFWTDRWENGFEFANHQKAQNATLMCVPLEFHRPADGTEIFIPSPLLPYRNRIGPDGTPPSTMWNYSRNEWQERSEPGSTWLSFSVPRELLPLTSRRARIDINVSGPVGLIEIKGMKNGEAKTLKTVVDPVGFLSVEIDDPEVLSIHDDATLYLGIIGGDPSRPELTHTKSDSAGTAKVNYWRINSLALQLWAKTDDTASQE